MSYHILQIHKNTVYCNSLASPLIDVVDISFGRDECAGALQGSQGDGVEERRAAVIVHEVHVCPRLPQHLDTLVVASTGGAVQGWHTQTQKNLIG